jgi:type IX secretion system PorP/SprF family membrane protein
LTILLVAFHTGLLAQDIHSSHLHSNPILLNPAMTGQFGGDFRFIADFRSQYRAVTTNYRTFYGSVDMRTRTLGNGNAALGLGLELFADRAGDLDFSTQGAQLSMSGLLLVGEYGGKKMISAGLKLGMVNQSVDFSKIDAFDPEPMVLSGLGSNRFYPDVSMGIAWSQELSRNKDRSSYYIGYSLSHVNRPVVAFGLDGGRPTDELYIRHVLHGGGDFKLGEQSRLLPAVLFMDQGPHRQITVGSFWKYHSKRIKQKKGYLPTTAIYLGAWARWYAVSQASGFDAMIFAIRLMRMNSIFTISYDINMSKLSLASAGRGGIEFSVTQIVDNQRQRSRKMKCPSFDY